MNKIKVFYIITKLELGGAQLYTLDLIKTLDRDKFQPVLLSSDHGFLVEEVKRQAFCKTYFLPALKREINPLLDLLAFVKIIKCIRDEKPDIVHTHSSKAGILGRWAAKIDGVKKIIHTIHGFPFYEYQNKIIKYFYIFLEKITAKITTQLITVSKSDIQKGLKYKIGTLEKYVTIQCIMPTERFKISQDEIDKVKADFRLKNGVKIVGMVACFKPQKAPLDFIEMCCSVLKRLPDTKFILVGDGILRKKIEQRIRQYNLEGKIILTGWRRDVPEILSVMDVFVLTSKWEGLPVAIMEAMYMGVPVVANCVDGVQELVQDKVTGYLVSPGDIEGMANRVVELLANDKKRITLAEQARHAVDNKYNITTMVNDTQQVYESLI
ncbi:MAG: glycosyltransferase family 4 protein [Candidatus Omnitrophota bacterium]